jgi:hypothetical protein
MSKAQTGFGKAFGIPNSQTGLSKKLSVSQSLQTQVHKKLDQP